MGKVKFALGLLFFGVVAVLVVFVFSSDHALLVHPKGIMARSELELIIYHVFLILSVMIPTAVLLFLTAWRYREKNLRAQFDPEKTHGVFKELILWIIPSIVIAVMIVNTWKETFKLDPFQPIKSDVKTLRIQVVALDWKWLFIYPEQGIASLNFVQFPIQTPIRFELAADGSPMNSFWIPQLSGQIYCMTGMVTPLHIMADVPGDYSGRAAEINGDGFADMIFVAKATSRSDFDAWVEKVKQSSRQLTRSTYLELIKPSMKNPVVLYSHVDEDLFNKIIMKYSDPASTTLWENSSSEN